MGLFNHARSRLLSISTVPLLLLLPSGAWAGWGDENWGEMVWGAGAPQIPAMTVSGVVAMALLLLILSYALFALRRRRSRRAPLHP